MMHSSPMPLNIALDLAKRLGHELFKHMTPDQRRDLARVQRLISEAQKKHVSELARARQSAPATTSSPGAPKGRW